MMGLGEDGVGNRCRGREVTSVSRRLTRRGIFVTATVALSTLVLAGSASAQVSQADRSCITTFNKNIRKVAKEQGRIVKKCLRDFASGRLVAVTPEDCIRSDPQGNV